MSHPDQLAFVGHVRDHMPQFFTGTRVLEVGSLDINGSVRQFFDGCDYTGIDVGPGPGVDQVVPGQDFKGFDGSYDVVISCECMEHNPDWQATVANMQRLLRPGGLFLLSCAAPGRKEHGTSRSDVYSSPLTVGLGQEHYRNLAHADFAPLADPFVVWLDWINWAAYDYYLVGVRDGEVPGRWRTVEAAVSGWVASRNAEARRVRSTRLVLNLFGTDRLETYVRRSDWAVYQPGRVWRKARRTLGLT